TRSSTWSSRRPTPAEAEGRRQEAVRREGGDAAPCLCLPSAFCLLPSAPPAPPSYNLPAAASGAARPPAWPDCLKPPGPRRRWGGETTFLESPQGPPHADPGGGALRQEPLRRATRLGPRPGHIPGHRRAARPPARRRGGRGDGPPDRPS